MYYPLGICSFCFQTVHSVAEGSQSECGEPGDIRAMVESGIHGSAKGTLSAQ